MEKEIFKVADELPNKNQFIDQQTLNPDVTGDINERILSVAAPSAVSGQRALQQTIPSNLQSIQTVQLPSGKFATTTEFSTVKPVRTGFEFAKTPDQVAHLTAGLRKSPQEQLVAVVLDKDDRPIQIIRHTIGVSNQAAAELWSLVGAIANTEGAKSYYISHNHPSGISTLSNPDKNLNLAIDYLTKNTNIENKGIMAVGGGNFSFASPSGQEIINQKITPAIRDKSINMVERTFRKSQVLDKNSISNDNDAKIIADKVAGNETGLLLLNNQWVPVGFLQVDKNKLTNLRKSGESTNILKALEKTNAGNAIFVTKENLSKDQIQNLEKLFNATGANLLSVLTGQQRVASATGTTSRDFLSVAPVGAGVLYGAQEDQKKKGGAVKSSLDMTGMNLFDILRTV